MKLDEIALWIAENFYHVRPKSSWGETAFFVNPDGRLPSGSYFATIKEKDGDNDKASNLDRPGVFRLNFGPGRKAFESLFGVPPARPAKGGIISGMWDFTAADQLMPHPVYGWMSWMCILNPTRASFDTVEPLLKLAHGRALASAQAKLENQC